jgi:hypothetical protein
MNLPQQASMQSQHVNIMPKANHMGLKTWLMGSSIHMIAPSNETGKAGIACDPVKLQFISSSRQQ